MAPTRGRLLSVAGLGLVWLLASSVAAWLVFIGSSRTVVVASHDTEVRLTTSGYVVVRSGPVVPDLRMPTDRLVGVDLVLGKTQAATTDELIDRYALIASQPGGQIAKVRGALVEMAWGAGLWGAVLGLLPVGVWVLVGRDRRRELRSAAWGPRGLGLLLVGALVLVAAWRPWAERDTILDDQTRWSPLADFVGPFVTLPDEFDRVEIRADVTTFQSRRLMESAVDTYRRSKAFYATAAEVGATLAVREAAEGETVAVLVSDRHDNVGMDVVVRAVADAAGATAILDAGDDTSVGEPWEAFSLDSLDEQFAGADRWAIAGNHDHGEFVSDYLESRGWTNPRGEVVDGPGGSLLAGADDPRSSGLGSWRDEVGGSVADQGVRLADLVCATPDRVGTLLVHDADAGTEALARGCVDLVVAGHDHVHLGPTRVEGANGAIGYTFTNGTTGGAAYAIAVGSKLRRPAGVSLVTYRDGRPVGIQAILIQTTGAFIVGRYTPLTY